MSIPLYLIKVNLGLVLCWMLYWLAFRKLTFFQWNRFYLLGSVVLSLILPLFRLPWNMAMAAAAEIGGIDWTYVDHLVSSPVAFTPGAESWSPRSLILGVYLAAALVLLLRKGWRFSQFFKSLKPSRRIMKGRVKVFLLDQQRGSFTLFRRIYLDRQAYEQGSRLVLKHEMAHAIQLHSLDLLLMEFVTAILWFNPFAFVLLRHVRENHEYLADRHASGGRSSLVEYLQCLKAETSRYFAPVPASYFKSSTIKKRIIMLTNHSSDQRHRWRYLGIVPVVAVMVVFLHTPARTGQARNILLMEEVLPVSLPVLLTDGTPSRFPLPDAYKDHISWGYDQEAIHPITRKKTTHQGIDIPAPTGTPVFATGQGQVKKASTEEGWGKLVVIEHAGGYTTVYAHLDEIGVEAGAKVTVGQEIGKVGNTGQSTGSHLHYEVLRNGEHVNPADYY